MKMFLIAVSLAATVAASTALAQDHSAGPNDVTYGTGNMPPGQGNKPCDAATPRNPVAPNPVPDNKPPCQPSGSASTGERYGNTRANTSGR